MNGDEMEDIIRTFRSIDYTNKKPHLLISHTTKGKGVSYMEGIANGIMACLQPNNMKRLFARYPKELKN